MVNLLTADDSGPCSVTNANAYQGCEPSVHLTGARETGERGLRSRLSAVAAGDASAGEAPCGHTITTCSRAGQELDERTRVEDLVRTLAR